ncbi:MAG TPA: VWA domain-containing protein, partial [Pyrinomonadaceae bacterium]|nr:VWA domain-containing protein [Pyrinomonadaceae bacterium]
MKKIAVILFCVGSFGLSVFAQTNRGTRPRVVPSPTPSVERQAPVLQNDTPVGDTVKRPPVLKGGNTPPQNQTQTQSPEIVGDVIEEDNEIIKVETNLVTFPVSVLDRDGRFISGLQQKDFKILENGVEQRIEMFQSVEQPFTVILMLDVSPSTQYKIDEIQNAAIAFVNQLRRDDKIMVIAFDEKVNILCRPTNDRSTLRNAIRQAQFGDGTS